jgi:hypothetical protein
MMTIALESMALTMPEVEGHPNRTAFRGVLTVVDEPSQRAPSGSGGRRVVLTKSAAEKALPSLLGMALDYAPSFDRHDVRRKVGVITSADIVGRNLEIGGFLYARDFPEIVEEIAKSGKRNSKVTREALPTPTVHAVWDEHTWTEGARLRASLSAAVERIRSLKMEIQQGSSKSTGIRVLRAEAAGTAAMGLGMSYEVTDVALENSRARVWTLTKVTFTGAAILRKNKAAYQETWIELGS